MNGINQIKRKKKYFLHFKDDDSFYEIYFKSDQLKLVHAVVIAHANEKNNTLNIKIIFQ